MNQLTNEDIGVLLDALTSWEQKDIMTDMMSTVVDSLINGKRNGTEQEEYERKKSDEKSLRDIENKLRKEKSILLKAKLIGIRDSVSVG